MASETPDVVRAYAFAAMGKICIRDKKLAANLINVYLRELEYEKHSTIDHNQKKNIISSSMNKSFDRQSNEFTSTAAVRSNCLLALGDFCMRYANLVDRHIGKIAVCLQVFQSNEFRDVLHVK